MRSRRQLEALPPGGLLGLQQRLQGRVGIYQVMPITEEIQRIILRDGSAMDIAEQAQREGVRDLRQSGLHQGRAGRDLARRSAGHQRVTNE
jgi:type IV pilus assembly protein PilB